ncbi:HIT family protein [Anaerobacillus isosaccharinicus]|uniref:Diadenosine tetraphosphate hydrolase n=1 Tax=Anaerobacillus isosaccharinicus TaxID=1532552 RepID=A0A1S2M3F8_9BACI|nr:HIT family protein [Anaerobacillus isosaccharinicus]MBA5586452.1 HIT family protein [Anaerobacillus isosaccharinicus]QOY35305.1 HIT family protein [Anaerobacillus isosaccharinicus]
MYDKPCPFCNPENIVLSNDLAFAIFDIYPVNQGHLLIIPKRNVSDFFDTKNEEREAINQLLEQGKTLLEERYSPDGYNIGINCGETAGQTIFHVHVHLIPRYKGDMENPRGGVRGVIPEKRIY